MIAQHVGTIAATAAAAKVLMPTPTRKKQQEVQK